MENSEAKGGRAGDQWRRKEGARDDYETQLVVTKFFRLSM